jgi:hypothetical protein
MGAAFELFAFDGRRVLSAFAHTLVDAPRVAMVTFGVAAGISPRVEAQRLENRRWATSFNMRNAHLVAIFQRQASAR